MVRSSRLARRRSQNRAPLYSRCPFGTPCTRRSHWHCSKSLHRNPSPEPRYLGRGGCCSAYGTRQYGGDGESRCFGSRASFAPSRFGGCKGEEGERGKDQEGESGRWTRHRVGVGTTRGAASRMQAGQVVMCRPRHESAPCGEVYNVSRARRWEVNRRQSYLSFTASR